MVRSRSRPRTLQHVARAHSTPPSDNARCGSMEREGATLAAQTLCFQGSWQIHQVRVLAQNPQEGRALVWRDRGSLPSPPPCPRCLWSVVHRSAMASRGRLAVPLSKGAGAAAALWIAARTRGCAPPRRRPLAARLKSSEPGCTSPRRSRGKRQLRRLCGSLYEHGAVRLRAAARWRPGC